jgi:acetoin utilization protein AcuB
MMITVADIMTPDPASCGRDTPLGEIIGLMKTHACRQVPVVEDGRVVGIVTDRDVRLAMNSPFTLHERSQDQAMLNDITAEACMTPHPLCIDVNETAQQAAKLIMEYKFGGLPVISEGRLVGIITTTDLIKSYLTLLAALKE